VKLFGDYFKKKISKNKTIMIVRKIMTDLLNYTKKIASKISYYDAIIDFTEESHWFNPFYRQPEVTVVWVENPEDDNWRI
jgi:hypothetical protein